MLVHSFRPELKKLAEVDAALLAAVNALPLPDAAERLFELSGQKAPESHTAARGDAVLGEILVGLDPYSSDFAASLDAALPFGRVSAVRYLLGFFPDLETAAALRQLWAVAAYRPLMAALLARGVLSSAVAAEFPELGPEMKRLLALALQVGPGRHQAPTELGSGPLRNSFLAKALVCCAQSELDIPALGGWREAKPGLRLRFQLAALSRSQADTGSLLLAATQIPGVTTYLVEREMSRAVAAARARGAELARLPALRSVSLPARAQRWLQKSAELRVSALEGAPTPYLRWSTRQQAAYAESLRLVAQLKNALQRADYTRAGKLLIAMPSGEVADLVLREQLAAPLALEGEISLPQRRSLRLWAPMAPDAAALWQKRVPGVELPAWCVCTQVEMLAGLVAGRWLWASFSKAECLRLRASWKAAEEQTLIAKGIFAAVSPSSQSWRKAGVQVAFQLAMEAESTSLPLLRKVLLGQENATPLLECVAATVRPDELRETFEKMMRALQPGGAGQRQRLSWFRWEAPLIGTAEWLAAPAWLRNPSGTLSRMPGYLRRGGRPLCLSGFIAVFEKELLAVAWPAQAVAQTLAQWMKVQPASAYSLLAELPAPALTALLKNRQLPADFAEAIAKHLAAAGLPVSETEIDYFRLRAPNHLEQVAAALWRQTDENRRALQWHPAWDLLPGEPELRDDCRLLLARSHARTVMAIAREFGSERFAAAARRVAARLATHHPRLAALLELSAPLAPEEIGALWVALAWCRRGASPGRLLDHTYRCYSLPKQSGGTRVIHAPAAPVKAAQRAVLRAYLAPLGAHPAACGFVAGRSIKDNAAPHVGQRVVANADVRQCFSSVGWTRVLGALRRDLGGQLSPAAIGLIGDLVTAEGCLPTGAPTSPALLNRVLLRSDEILTQLAAVHRVNYTRYADDLSFSGEAAAVKMLGHAKRVLAQVGLELDPKKTHIFRRGRRQMVTGLVVNSQVSVPRKLRRELRAAVHAAENGKPVHWHGAAQSPAALHGRLAYLAMAHPAEAQALRKRLQIASEKLGNASPSEAGAGP